jgi:hypothetical protein
MESAAPGVVDPGVGDPGVPDRSAPVDGSPEMAVVSQLPPCCPVSPDCDGPALDGGHPKSLCDEDPAAPPPVPLPRLKPLDPLFVLFDPPKPEDPKLLELPNPDDPLCPEPNALLDPFEEFGPFWPFWPSGEVPAAGPSVVQESSTAPAPLA